MSKIKRKDLVGKKWLITGLAGQGKTYLAKTLSSVFDSSFIYAPQDRISSDWEDTEERILYIPENFIEDFPMILKLVKGLKEKIDCLVVDDGGMLFKSHFDTSKELRELITSARNWGICIIFTAKRPQSIPAEVYNQFEYLALFKIDAPQVLELLDRYYKDLGKMVNSLEYNSHNFVLKKPSEKPIKTRV